MFRSYVPKITQPTEFQRQVQIPNYKAHAFLTTVLSSFRLGLNWKGFN